MIYVNAKSFKLRKTSRFLFSKNVEFEKIIRIIDNKTYELEISKHLKQKNLHFVFHS